MNGGGGAWTRERSWSSIRTEWVELSTVNEWIRGLFGYVRSLVVLLLFLCRDIHFALIALQKSFNAWNCRNKLRLNQPKFPLSLSLGFDNWNKERFENGLSFCGACSWRSSVSNLPASSNKCHDHKQRNGNSRSLSVPVFVCHSLILSSSRLSFPYLTLCAMESWSCDRSLLA